MSDSVAHIFNKLFEKITWLECKGILHVGSTTGKPGHWVAHPLCRRKLRNWVGFSEIQYAKTDKVCDVCLLLYFAGKTLGDAEK